jgi:hypothetical protein
MIDLFYKIIIIIIIIVIAVNCSLVWSLDC